MAKSKSPKRVETLTHADAKRTNIPTAEHQAVMSPEDQAPVRLQEIPAEARQRQGSVAVRRWQVVARVPEETSPKISAFRSLPGFTLGLRVFRVRCELTYTESYARRRAECAPPRVTLSLA